MLERTKQVRVSKDIAKGEYRAKTATLALVVVALIVLLVEPASAQEGGMEMPARSPDTTSQSNDNTLYSGAYAVTDDGTLIYGGDAAYQCEDLVKTGAPAQPESDGTPGATINGAVVEPLTREAVELCAEAGFPPEGASFSASNDADNLESGEPSLLPETGGAALTALVLGAVAFAVAAALLTLRVKR